MASWCRRTAFSSSASADGRSPDRSRPRTRRRVGRGESRPRRGIVADRASVAALRPRSGFWTPRYLPMAFRWDLRISSGTRGCRAVLPCALASSVVRKQLELGRDVDAPLDRSRYWAPSPVEPQGPLHRLPVRRVGPETVREVGASDLKDAVFGLLDLASDLADQLPVACRYPAPPALRRSP
jgi:hypothetical protein